METRSSRAARLVATAAVLLALSPGCGGDDGGTEQPAGCETLVGGVCAGVPGAPLCDAATCTEGVACSEVKPASDDASLAAAAADAEPGSCIALGPGNYGQVDLAEGVSLLGRAAAEVKVAGVNIAAGDGAVVRGVTVGAGGVVVAGASNVRIEAVLIDGAGGAGLDVSGGASVALVASEVTGGGQFGARALDASLIIERSVLAGVAGPGVWAECAGGCDCADRPAVALIDSIVREDQLVGAAFVGVDASLDNVEISGIGPHELSGGGGVVAQQCATLAAKATVVRDNRMYGILVDGSGAEIGGPDEADTVKVSGNRVGIWVQNQADDGSQQAILDHVEVLGNFGVGVGSSGTIKGFVIYGTEIRDTAADELIVAGGTKKTVGDGLLWAEGAMLTVDGVTLSGNARQSVLIDGPVAAGSSIANVALENGDEQTGILQQRFSGGEAPEIGAGAPALEQREEIVFEVPAPPAAPVAK